MSGEAGSGSKFSRGRVENGGAGGLEFGGKSADLGGCGRPVDQFGK